MKYGNLETSVLDHMGLEYMGNLDRKYHIILP